MKTEYATLALFGALKSDPENEISCGPTMPRSKFCDAEKTFKSPDISPRVTKIKILVASGKSGS
ncbi:hypothetical protein [Paenibacillus sp. R14(2021)]|uniref:hypothetical protein n=1 Tax=Paenibacillus sp. R14(2021) TaxID=2859228 RepID=UPI001C6163ED|nr:hypothetical protein [Paenibacillus sp. R14(2021)]